MSSLPTKKLSPRAGAATVHSAALYRQVHFFEEFGVSRVVVQISKQRITVDLRPSGLSLCVGTLQPSEPFLGLPAIRIHLSYLMRPLIAILRDKTG